MRHLRPFTKSSSVYLIIGCLAILALATPTAEASTICRDLFRTQQVRPALENLPPPYRKPNEIYVYQVTLPSDVNPRAAAHAIEKFLESKQMSHLHAQLAVNSGGMTIWSDPINIAVIRRQFSDSRWTWGGDFVKVVDPIHPKIQAEIDRQIALSSDIAQDLYRTLFVRNFKVTKNGERHLSFLTSSQLAQRKTIEELTVLYSKRKSEMKDGYLLKKEGNPERLWNSARYNRTEDIEMRKADLKFDAVESYLNAASALTDAGLGKLSGGSEKYYRALRRLPDVSDTIKSDKLKNEILEAAAKAKLMTESDVSKKARAEGIGRALSAAYQGIRRSNGDPLLLEVGYGLLNRLLENVPYLDLGKFTYIAFENAQSSVFNREEDGLEGPLQMGHERVAFLQSMLRSEFVSERPRLAAQSLLRRVIETQNSDQEIRLLPKEKFEEIYLRFAAQVTTEARHPGMYKFGFFINESYGMQSEVSPQIVLADREAVVNGVELANWNDPKQAAARLASLLPGRTATTPKQPLLLEYRPSNVPRTLVFESSDFQVFYSTLTGKIEVLRSSKEPIVLQHFRNRNENEVPEIQIINGTIVITDPKTETAKQYRLSDGHWLRTFEPAKYSDRRIREEHRRRQQ